MLSEKEVMLVYETILSGPGMDEHVKIDFRVPRKIVLLLSKVIERGLEAKGGEVLEALLQAAGADAEELLKQLPPILLTKAGLSAMHEKLATLQRPGKKES